MSLLSILYLLLSLSDRSLLTNTAILCLPTVFLLDLLGTKMPEPRVPAPVLGTSCIIHGDAVLCEQNSFGCPVSWRVLEA